MNLLVSAIAGFLSGIIGSMGFGGGGVLIIYLVIFMDISQLTAQGINLIFFIPCAVLATIIYSTKKQIDFKAILPVIIGGILGAIFASLFLKNIKTEFLSKLFAIFLITMGISSFFRMKKTSK